MHAKLKADRRSSGGGETEGTLHDILTTIDCGRSEAELETALQQLRHTVEEMFEIPGVFEAVKAYLEDLEDPRTEDEQKREVITLLVNGVFLPLEEK